ncbi:MAG: hypothetical protein A4E19_10825 [Nitrospira sp. SG-bin1]|nr:MAG: hypothetical protein A4E19_10825 [Nitrospira sp. SG-bin1]
MKVTRISMSTVVVVLLSGLLEASGACAAYESIVNKRVVTRTEQISAEEALLTFRIEEAGKRISPFGCVADKKMERDRRLLDPQLSPPIRETISIRHVRRSVKEPSSPCRGTGNASRDGM